MPEISKLAEEVESSLGEFPCEIPADGVTVEVRDSCIVDNGEWYAGTWSRQSLRHGKGKVVYPDGSTYQGTWRNDQPSGNGRLISADGSYYIGDFSRGQKSGNGELVNANGSFYTGEWK